MSEDVPSSQPDPGTPPDVPLSTKGAPFQPPSIEEMNAALPQYQFVEMIGVGGMGAVYKALQPKLNRHVAIKILPPIPDDELGFTERFEREAQSMAQLNHPHIVSVFDFGETEDGQLYFVMEFIEGADLHHLISEGDLTLDHFYGWIPQVCDAIQYAHDHGIVHRDIKPANILINKEGRVKIADFGLAKLVDADQPQTALTLADLSMGTPDYASPEQMEASHDIDWRSDIYSLGVVMYQMLTGKLPRGAYPMPSEIHDEMDARLDEVVLKAMQTEPASRFQHASDISDFLTRIRTTPPAAVGRKTPATAPADSPAPKPAPREQKSLLPIVGIIVGISVISGLLGLGIKALNQKKPSPSRQSAPAMENKNETNERPGNAGQGAGKKPSIVKAPAKKTPVPPSPVKVDAPKFPQEQRQSEAPRDFSRRPGPGAGAGNGGRGPGNFEKFRDKLGKKPAQVARRNFGNLVIIDRHGDPLENAGILARPPLELKGVHQVVTGQQPAAQGPAHHFVVVLQVDGKVLAWGDNSHGQLDVPASLGPVRSIAAGSGHVVALQADGRVLAWGDNRNGQATVPEDLGSATAVAAGHDFSIALLEDGSVRAWGAAPFVSGAPGPDFTPIVAIDAGHGHAIALRENGQVMAWGPSQSGRMNPHSKAGRVVSIAATNEDTVILTDEGILLFATVADGTITGSNASDVDSPEIGFVESITGAGPLLVARDRKGKLTLHDGTPRPIAMPAFMRMLPHEFDIAFAGNLVFACRPAPLLGGVTDDSSESGPPTTETTPLPEVSDTEAGREIATLQEQFEQAYVDQVSGPWEDSISQLNEFYLNHLEQRQAESAAQSDLETALAWRSEAEMIRDGDPLPEVDAPELLPELHDLRQTYRQKSAEHAETRSLAEAELLTRYDAALQALQDRFTGEQKLDDALEVRTFRDSLE